MSDNDSLTRKEAAELLGVHPGTIRLWYDYHGLPGQKRGNTLFFKRTDLLAFERPQWGGKRDVKPTPAQRKVDGRTRSARPATPRPANRKTK